MHLRFLSLLSLMLLSCSTSPTDSGSSLAAASIECDNFGLGVAFSCTGASTGSEKLVGIYSEGRSETDRVILNSSSKFGVSDDSGARCLLLKRDSSPLKSGDFLDFDIQFLNVQTRSGLGKYKTRFSSPMGTFGAQSGTKFKALLSVTSDGYREGEDRLHKLDCEIN